MVGVGLRDRGGLDELAEALPGAQVWRLDDEGRDVGGPAPAAARAPAGAPALALVMTCAGNNAQASAAVGAPHRPLGRPLPFGRSQMH